LVKAVEEGKIVDVRRFLEEGADPNSRGDFGSMRDVRLMKIAIFKEQPEIVRMLIEAGVDIEGKDPNNVATPLTAAIGQGHMETVGVLLELGAKVRNGDLGTAAGYGTPEMMRRLMQEGITVDDLYLSYTPAIKHAAEMKRFENVDFLLEHGGDIDALDANDKHTALTYAVDKRDLEVAEFLLSRGADVDKANGEGMTALVYAAGKGDIYLLRLLLAHGANADTMTDVGFTGLLMAVLNRQKESVRVLLAHGANVDKAAANGTTPLMFAAALNEYEIAKLIVEKGADVNVVAKSGDLAGHSALSIAREAGHTEFAALLRAAGAREP
jgi:ankyrin repeat protein